MQDLKRVRYVTANYASLQGLKMVPLGLWLWLGAAGGFGWWPWYKRWRPVSGLLALCVACVLWLLVGFYYTRTFGRVQPTPQRTRHMLLIGVMVLVVGCPWLLISGFIDAAMQPPVSVLGLTVAVLLALWCSTGNLQKHYLIAVVLIAGVSFLPLLDIISRDRLFGGVFSAIVGSVLIVGGITDHLLLLRNLKPLLEEHHDGDI